MFGRELWNQLVPVNFFLQTFSNAECNCQAFVQATPPDIFEDFFVM